MKQAFYGKINDFYKHKDKTAVEKSEEEKKVETMIFNLSEENKKCAIAAAEALLYAQVDSVMRATNNEMVSK